MNRVVYVLGAGFSAPLGLPVAANFLTKANDIHSGKPETHRHFDKVLELIGGLARCKEYFETSTARQIQPSMI